MNEEELFKKIEPIIIEIKALHEQIYNLVNLGIITQEQADDITGATIDKLAAEDKWEKIKNAKAKTLTKRYHQKKGN